MPSITVSPVVGSDGRLIGWQYLNSLITTSTSSTASCFYPSTNWTSSTPIIGSALVTINATSASLYLSNTATGVVTLPHLGVYDVATASQTRLYRPNLRRSLADRQQRLEEGKQALKRSLALYRSVRGSAELNRFLAGDWITVRGRMFDYRMRKQQDLLDHTMYPRQAHIPYRLEALCRDTGRVLASGCVIIPDTPVIDQLLAVVLHAGDEEEEIRLLRKTNWTPPIMLPAAVGRSA